MNTVEVVEMVNALLEAALYVSKGEYSPDMIKLREATIGISPLDVVAFNALKAETVSALYFQQRTTQRLLETL